MPDFTRQSCVRRASVWLLLSAVLAIVAGCGGDTGDSPTLQCREINHRQMPAFGPGFPAPRGMNYDDDGRLMVLDNAGRVLVFGLDRNVEKQWFMPEFEVGKPEGICLFPDGRIGVADTHYHRVVFFDADGNVLSMHGSEGREPGEFIYPVAITHDDSGNYYVGEYGDEADRIQKFAPDGSFLLEFGGFGSGDGLFQRPSGIVWRDGLVYAADAINNRIQVFTDDGQFVRILGAPANRPDLNYPYDLVSGPDDDLFVIEHGGRLTRLNLDGRVLGTYGSPGRERGKLFTPWGVAAHADGRVAIADTGNRRIVELKR